MPKSRILACSRSSSERACSKKMFPGFQNRGGITPAAWAAREALQDIVDQRSDLGERQVLLALQAIGERLAARYSKMSSGTSSSVCPTSMSWQT
jgi:hypothetical protein